MEGSRPYHDHLERPFPGFEREIEPLLQRIAQCGKFAVLRKNIYRARLADDPRQASVAVDSKGGQPDAMRILHAAPRLEDIWQLHVSLLSGQEYTVPGIFIANTVDDQPDTMPIAPMSPPAWPRARHRHPSTTGRRSGSRSPRARMDRFTVTNARNGFSKTYASR